jgi:SseB protein N-terminal domain
MMELTAGSERFRDDHGEADLAVAAALEAYAAGTGGEHAVLTALADSRLLVPVVAVLADELASPAAGAGDGEAPAGPPAGQAGLPREGEKASEMAMPAIVGRDGRRALPAFTSADAVRRWQPTARPVPVPASGVWQSAAHESWAVVIDIAGPVPVVVEGARLTALAEGAKAPGMHEDPDVWHEVAAAAAEIAPGIRVKLSPAPEGVDFTLELAPPAGAARPVPDEAASQIAARATARLGGRVRAGIAVIVRPPS